MAVDSVVIIVKLAEPRLLCTLCVGLTSAEADFDLSG